MGIVKDLLYKVSSKTQFKTRFKKEAMFPYYHIVADEKQPHIKYLYAYKNIQQFISDVNLLKSKYKPLLPDNIIKNRKGGFLLTFDDGLREIYTTIYPILKRKGLTAIFFINPDFVDNNKMMHKHRLSVLFHHIEKLDCDKNILKKVAKICEFNYRNTSDFKQKFMNLKSNKEKKINEVFVLLNVIEKQYLQENKMYISKDEIQEMMDNGFYFGGHTMTHRSLLTLTFEEQKKEVNNSVLWLKENFKIDYSLFAFPFSDKGISLKLIQEIFEHDPNIILFGNSGIKQDVDSRIIQRFSLENPTKDTSKVIVMENLYKYYNKIIGKYNIKRH